MEGLPGNNSNKEESGAIFKEEIELEKPGDVILNSSYRKNKEKFDTKKEKYPPRTKIN